MLMVPSLARTGILRVLTSIVFAGMLLPTLASAQEYQPYAEARITKSQWQSYFDQVKGKFGSTETHPSTKLVQFNSADTFYIFTEVGHPAHPAWVTQQIVKMDGGLGMRQVGYFAGEESAFATLFQACRARIAKVREGFKIKSQQLEKQ
jgi:hypothetical protein